MDLDEELLIDRFCAIRKAAPPPPQAQAQAPAPAAAPPRAPAAPVEAASPAPVAGDQEESDTGRLRLEVEEYMKERSGFNPNDLE